MVRHTVVVWFYPAIPPFLYRCFLALSKAHQAQRQIEAHHPQPITMSLDPKRDRVTDATKGTIRSRISAIILF